MIMIEYIVLLTIGFFIIVVSYTAINAGQI